jgi:hypothetical protein
MNGIDLFILCSSRGNRLDFKIDGKIQQREKTGCARGAFIRSFFLERRCPGYKSYQSFFVNVQLPIT